MTTELTALAAPATAAGFTRDQIDLIKRTVADGTSDDELALFLEVCRSTGLNPFQKQIYAIMRDTYNSKTKRKEPRMTIQTGIDGYRLMAARTGQHAGTDDAVFDTETAPAPTWARVTVRRLLAGGMVAEFTATARWREYAQTYDGNPSGMWAKMPYQMLAKCAEAQALRKAFPAELSGVYTAEEMAQADNEPKADEPAREPSHSRRKWVAQTLEWAAGQGVAEGDVARILADNGLPGIWELKADQCVRLGNLLHAEIERRAKPPEQKPIDVEFEDV